MISKNQIKHINSLHLKKFRDENHCFIAEGVKIVDEMVLHKGGIIKEIFATEEYLKKHKVSLEKNKISYCLVSEDELKKISTQNNPNQVLAICNFFDEEKSRPDLTK